MFTQYRWLFPITILKIHLSLRTTKIHNNHTFSFSPTNHIYTPKNQHPPQKLKKHFLHITKIYSSLFPFSGEENSIISQKIQKPKNTHFSSPSRLQYPPLKIPNFGEKTPQNHPKKLESERDKTGSSGGPNHHIRYRSPSAAELHFLEGQTTPLTAPIGGDTPGFQDADKMNKRKNFQQESLFDKLYRYRGVVLVITLPLVLISFVLFMMPRPGDGNDISRKMKSVGVGGNRYAVIFDAGSSGSRVHVFCFDQNLDLVPIGNDLELFVQKKPGLSAYASDPVEAANSLVPLLEEAVNVVPEELRGKTPVRVGATAGLRQLAGDAPDRILQAVKDLLTSGSSLKADPSDKDWVTVLDGTQEGAFQWVTINYLLGNLGKKYSSTVGVVDLGGGSVQMAYAISESDAAKAPKPSPGEEVYVRDMYLKGRKYHLYVHSYLHYGLLAARAGIIKAVGDSGNPCILEGYDGSYTYGGVTYKVSASPSGPDVDACQSFAVKALKVNETCTHMQCSFGGVWNGGGGDGQKNLFVASFFFDRAAEAGFVDSKKSVATVRPSDFKEAARLACGTKLEEGKSKYPNVEGDNLPYLCMDLVFQYTLLVNGFGLDPSQSMTLVKKVPYGNSLVEAAWPLGSAIDVMSSLA